jgi:hypothetical protein
MFRPHTAILRMLKYNIFNSTLTEISTRSLPCVKCRLSCNADNLTAICEPIVWENLGASPYYLEKFTFS